MTTNLKDVKAGYGLTSTINSNNDTISSELDTKLSRTLAGFNNMEVPLDMGNNAIVNLPGAISESSPVTLGQAAELAGVENPLTSESVGGVLYPRTAAEAAASIADYDAANTAGDITNPEFPAGDVRRYGASDNNSTDASDAFSAAVLQGRETNGARVTGVGRFALTSVVNMRGVPVDLSRASINIAHSGTGVIVGGNRNLGSNPKQMFGKVTRSVGTDSSADPTMQIVGAGGQHIEIQETGWLQLYADSDVTTPYASSAIQYSTFVLGRALTVEINTNPSPSGSTSQYINENQFYINRISHFICDGTYGHNNNRFYGGNFEWDFTNDTPASIDFNIGSSNVWYDLRFEYRSPEGETPVEITFDSSARFNKIFQNWTSSLSDYGGEYIYGDASDTQITDNGVGNVVVKQDSILREHSVVGSASFEDYVFDTTVGDVTDRKPSLAVVQAEGAYDNLLTTKKFRVHKGDVIGFNCEPVGSVEPRYRLKVTFWDSDGNPSSPVLMAGQTPVSGDNYSSGSLRTIAENRISMSNESEGAYVTIIDDADLAWAEATVYSGITNSDNSAGSISIFVRRQPYDNRIAQRGMIPDMTKRSVAVDGVPTQGFAPLGFTVDDISCSRWTVTNSVDTTLAIAASLGDQQITVASGDASTVEDGDIVGILNDDNEVTDWDVVNGAPSGDVVTLTGTLTGACASGNRVVFMRWEGLDIEFKSRTTDSSSNVINSSSLTAVNNHMNLNVTGTHTVTLRDGTIDGQQLTFLVTSSGGNVATITPDNLQNATSVAIGTNQFDHLTLIWNESSSHWRIVNFVNGATIT